MKKRVISFLLMVCLVFTTGCSSIQQATESKDSYQQHYGDEITSIKEETLKEAGKSVASQVAVIAQSDVTEDSYENIHEGLLINNTTNEVVYAQDIYEKAYPASTTKILTALLTLENKDLDEVVTIDQDITFGDSSAVALGLNKGDKITIEALLNALLLMSANDAAIALGRSIAGTDAKFAAMMNKRAKELGATHSHFVNPNGLHDDQHYTTAYDLYLIFRELIKHNEFSAIAGQASNSIEYTTAKNKAIAYDISTTNGYLLGDYNLPHQVFMIGGKTGTTTPAGSCLILLTKNEAGDEFISVILKATNHQLLYETMTDLLEKEN